MVPTGAVSGKWGPYFFRAAELNRLPRKTVSLAPNLESIFTTLGTRVVRNSGQPLHPPVCSIPYQTFFSENHHNSSTASSTTSGPGVKNPGTSASAVEANSGPDGDRCSFCARCFLIPALKSFKILSLNSRQSLRIRYRIRQRKT